jgi:hypothetical protein
MKRLKAGSFPSTAILLGVVLTIILIGMSCGPVTLAPLTPDKPDGYTDLEAGVSYTFSTSAIDPDSDVVAYRFDWGDGVISDWGSFMPSGKLDTASHTWTKGGSFSVKAQAKDGHSNLSPWSPGLAVIVDTSLMGAYYFEGFEQESARATWELTGAFSYFSTSYPHSGNYSVVLGDTGGGVYNPYFAGGVLLQVPIDVRNYSSAIVSFWYQPLRLPEGRTGTMRAEFVYMDNSSDWHYLYFPVETLYSTNSWHQMSLDVSIYCGIMRQARINIGTYGANANRSDGISVAVDDISIRRRD